MGELSENKPFETEVRFVIDDVKAFRNRVSDLDAKLLREYSFTDYYYVPKQETWDIQQKSIRIREWRQPELATAVWFTQQEVTEYKGVSFKRSEYEEGKVRLFEGELPKLHRILGDLGFKPSYTIDKKHGWVWEVHEHNLEFCLEEVADFGWTGEIELDGTDFDAILTSIAQHQELLGLRAEQLSGKPLAALVEERG